MAERPALWQKRPALWLNGLPVPSRDVVLTDARARALSERVKRIRGLFPYDLDVEWVLEGERFWIVQARAFLGADPAAPRP